MVCGCFCSTGNSTYLLAFTHCLCSSYRTGDGVLNTYLTAFDDSIIKSVCTTHRHTHTHTHKLCTHTHTHTHTLCTHKYTHTHTHTVYAQIHTHTRTLGKDKKPQSLPAQVYRLYKAVDKCLLTGQRVVKEGTHMEREAKRVLRVTH